MFQKVKEGGGGRNKINEENHMIDLPNNLSNQMEQVIVIYQVGTGFMNPILENI